MSGLFNHLRRKIEDHEEQYGSQAKSLILGTQEYMALKTEIALGLNLKARCPEYDPAVFCGVPVRLVNVPNFVAIEADHEILCDLIMNDQAKSNARN